MGTVLGTAIIMHAVAERQRKHGTVETLDCSGLVS